MEGTIKILNSKYKKCEITSKTSKIIINNYENIGNIFTNDIVKIENNKISQIKSNINNIQIIGLIEYESKYKFGFNKRGIEKYKFIPLLPNYPNFIVASKSKKKYKNNVIAVIKFLKWKDTLPYGEIINILGLYNDMNVLYNGILYKYNLNRKSIKLNKTEIYNLKNLTFNENLPNYDNITNHNIISIDPEGTLDIDDALSFYKISNNVYKIGIHISDVIGNLRILKLTKILNNLTSSIYLPNKVIDMLPKMLSNNILSLLPNKKRLAISLWLNIKDNKIINTNISKSIIINKKKYSYDEFELKHFNNKDSKYYEFIKLVKKLKYNNLSCSDSHKFIEKLMIIANCEIIKILEIHNKKIIYRKHDNSINIENYKNIDENLFKFLNIIKSKSAIYTYSNTCTNHHALNILKYTHYTSPIRRFVDCYIHNLIHQVLDKSYKENINIDIEKINIFNKNLKIAEREFSKLTLYNNIKRTNDNEFNGYIYDFRNNLIFVYIPCIKLSISKCLIDNKLKEILHAKYDKKNIYLNNNKNTNNLIIKLFKLYKFNIYLQNNKYNPYDKLIIYLEDLKKYILTNINCK